MVALGLIAGTYLVHGYHVLRTAVDAPRHDDWALTRWDHLSWLGWIVTLHVDHPLSFTKLLASTMDALGGWNVEIHRRINFGLYGLQIALLIAVLMRACRSVGTPASRAVFLPFLLVWPAVTTFNWLNHVWAIQTSYHLFVAFTMLAAFGLQSRGTRAWILTCVAACAVLQTLAAGLVVAPLALAVLVYSRRDRQGRRGSAARWLCFGVAVLAWGVSIVRYLRGGTMGTFPSEVERTDSVLLFLRLLGRAFVPDGPESMAGGVILLLMLGLGLRTLRRVARLRRESLGLVFSVMVCVSFLGLVAWGRDLDAIGQNQYAEIQALLPSLLGAWLLTSWRGSVRGFVALAGLLVVVVFGFQLGQVAPERYEQASALDQETVECAVRRWREWAPRNCVQAFPPRHDFTTDLAHARRDQTTLYQRTLPGSDTSPPDGLARGRIEQVEVDWDHVELTGWTSTPGALVLRSNGRVVVPQTLERVPRRNRSRRFGLPEDTEIGFWIQIRRDDAPTAQLDGIQVLVETEEGRLQVAADFDMEGDNAVWADGRRLPRAESEALSVSVVSAAPTEWRLLVEPALSEEQWQALEAVVLRHEGYVPVAVDPQDEGEATADGSSRVRVHWSEAKDAADQELAVVLLSPQRGFVWLEALPDADGTSSTPER